MRYNLKFLLLLVTLASVTAAVIGARGMMGACYAWWFWSAIIGVVAYWSRRALCVVLALVMFLGAFLAVPITFGVGHPVPLWRLNRVRHGMTERQVQETLGRPTSIYGANWVYESDWTFCYITIAFSDDGRVLEVVHDH